MVSCIFDIFTKENIVFKGLTLGLALLTMVRVGVTWGPQAIIFMYVSITLNRLLLIHLPARYWYYIHINIILILRAC